MMPFLVFGVVGLLPTRGPPTSAHARRAPAHVQARMPWEPQDDATPNEMQPNNEKSIGLSGLMKLVAMGAGAPMLGDLKENTLLQNNGEADLKFELEANNFADKNGNLKRGKYFEDGWVDDGEQGPSFFDNLLSGGKLQREFDQKQRVD